MAQTTTIAAVGDICPGDHYFSLGHGAGSLDDTGRSRALEGLKDLLCGADIAIANLEGVLSPTSEILDPVESRVFRGPREWAISLRAAGLTAVSVANNHSLQHGESAFWNTVDACREAGLEVVGLASSNGLPRPVLIRIGTKRFALVGASFVPDPRRSDRAKTYAHPPLESLVDQVHSLSRSGQLVILCVHAGEEARLLPDRTTMQTIDSLVSAGARAVLVHHSHVFQPVLKTGSAIVATGLGDCFFDLHWHRKLTTAAVVKLVLHDEAVDMLSLHPFRITKDLRIEKMPNRERASFLMALEQRAELLLGNSDGPLEDPDWMQVRKALYFLRNLPRGDTSAKLRFFAGKVLHVARSRL